MYFPYSWLTAALLLTNTSVEYITDGCSLLSNLDMNDRHHSKVEIQKKLLDIRHPSVMMAVLCRRNHCSLLPSFRLIIPVIRIASSTIFLRGLPFPYYQNSVFAYIS